MGVAELIHAVGDKVLNSFVGSDKRRREKRFRIFSQLADDSFPTGDTIQSDHVGRLLQTKRFGEWSIT